MHLVMRGTRRNIKLLTTVWVISVIVTMTIIPRYIKFVKYCMTWPPTQKYQDLPLTFNTCTSRDRWLGLYSDLSCILTFLIAVICNCVLYFKIVLTLHRRSSSSVQDSRQVDRAITVRNQVTRTLVATGIIFFLCQLLYRFYSISSLMNDFGIVILDKQSLHSFDIIGQLFLGLNCTINPYLYVFSCQHYRKAFWDAFGLK